MAKGYAFAKKLQRPEMNTQAGMYGVEPTHFFDRMNRVLRMETRLLGSFQKNNRRCKGPDACFQICLVTSAVMRLLELPWENVPF
jgi:hypothetical protein